MSDDDRYIDFSGSSDGRRIDSLVASTYRNEGNATIFGYTNASWPITKGLTYSREDIMWSRRLLKCFLANDSLEESLADRVESPFA